MEKKQLLG